MTRRDDGQRYHGRACKQGHTLRYASGTCVTCHAERAQRNYDPEARREKSIKTYGITLAEYQAILAHQNDRCAICEAAEPGGKGRWHIDHDHNTGRVRGLLCHRCNVGIGNLGDDPERLQRAISYLHKTGR